MPDKQAPRATALFPLPSHAIVAIEGRDAVAFTQAQFANDVARLAVGEWQWNAWLTPKGRVLAIFALLHQAEETLWMLLPDADAAPALVASLQRFVFRSKVAIAVREDLSVSGAFAAPRVANGALAAIADGVELDMGSAVNPRRMVIHAARVDRLEGAPGATVAPPVSGDAAWTQADLAHGLPRLVADQADRWTPQQLGLERLRAYSVHKGCYPGQEIVARTHFLGQAKRGARLLAVDASVRTGDTVVHDDADIGTVCSVANGTPTLALAVLPLAIAAGAMLIAGRPTTTRSLLDGLAR